MINDRKYVKFNLESLYSEPLELKDDPLSKLINKYDVPAFSNENGRSEILETQNMNTKQIKHILWVSFESQHYLFDLEQRTIRHHASFTIYNEDDEDDEEEDDNETLKPYVDCFNNLIMRKGSHLYNLIDIDNVFCQTIK